MGWSSEAPVAVSSLWATIQPWVTLTCTHRLLGYIPFLPQQRLKTNHISMIKLQSHSKSHSGVAPLPRCHLEGWAPHGANVVKKMYILARKVVTEPCRHSFISTSRAKSRGSRTDLCRDTTPV